MSTFSSIISFFNSITKDFPDPNFFLEQYSTSIDVLEAYFNLYPTSKSDIILDLGVGTGILSFLAFQKKAKKVIGFDIDRKVLSTARQNAQQLNISTLNLIHTSIEFFNLYKFRGIIHGVIMNPPFGTKRKFLDFVFLKKGMSTNGWILTLHKNNYESDKKLSMLCKENNYVIESKVPLVYKLPNTHKKHKLVFYPVEVTLYLLVPNM